LSASEPYGNEDWIVMIKADRHFKNIVVKGNKGNKGNKGTGE